MTSSRKLLCGHAYHQASVNVSAVQPNVMVRLRPYFLAHVKGNLLLGCGSWNEMDLSRCKSLPGQKCHAEPCSCSALKPTETMACLNSLHAISPGWSGELGEWKSVLKTFIDRLLSAILGGAVMVGVVIGGGSGGPCSMAPTPRVFTFCFEEVACLLKFPVISLSLSCTRTGNSSI